MTVQTETTTRPVTDTVDNPKPIRRAPTEMVVGIDVGTTKVCSIAGLRKDDGGFHILAHRTVPCNGLSKGNVSDIDATGDAIQKSVHSLQEAIGFKIESAYVGVTGSDIAFENRRDDLDPISGHGVITAEDLDREPQALAEFTDEPGRQLIHALRMTYSIEGEDGIRNPIGMHSNTIEVDTHMVTAATVFVDKLATAVEQAGISVTGMVLEPMASGLAVMTPAERIRGTVLVDIGGGTTDVVGFRQGRVCFTGVIPVGGFQFTNDIAVTYNTSYEAAENAKLTHASTDIPRFGQDVSLPVTGSDVDLRVEIAEICQLVRERANELARLIKIKLDESDIEGLSKYKIVLTGGSSNLPGISELFQKSLAVAVRRGVPGSRDGFPDELRNPRYATAVGILQWATEQQRPKTDAPAPSIERKQGGRRGLVAGLVKQISRLVPRAYFAAKKGRN
jgi:cell division protein FtsA